MAGLPPKQSPRVEFRSSKSRMTVPKAIDVISDMVRNSPNLIVGAGTVLDLETARRCIAAGAGFLTSPGLNLKIVEFAVKENILIIAGAMTPTEVIDAWQAGSELVKVFPCAPIGGRPTSGR